MRNYSVKNSLNNSKNILEQKRKTLKLNFEFKKDTRVLSIRTNCTFYVKNLPNMTNVRN